MTITKDVIFVGVDDTKCKTFEGQYPVSGMTYNSYVIMDDKIAIMDTADEHVSEAWLANVKKALKGKQPDYLVVHHLEPDHSAGIKMLAELYPDMKVVGNDKTFAMLPQYHNVDLTDRKIVVKENDTLCLGKHTLTFLMAPMVHWPEVMVSYDSCDKILFSADGFGRFGAMADKDWADEGARYYFNIVGKYGMQVQLLLQKAAKLDISIICPLHGNVLKDNLAYYIGLYDTWSKYQAEKQGVFVIYCSMHGNTAKAANTLADILRQKGCPVETECIVCKESSFALSNAFRYGKIVLAAPSYNAGVMPPMEDLLHHLKGKNFCNKTVALIENGSWAPSGANTMKALLADMKNITIVEPVVTVRGAVKEADVEHLTALADKLIEL